MALHRSVAVIALVSVVSGCTNTIAPTYTSHNPDIMQIGGSQPVSPDPAVENVGSFCVQTTEVWKADGKTPDGQSLWSKDTLRTVVPCP
jgi:hypothetical protein